MKTGYLKQKNTIPYNNINTKIACRKANTRNHSTQTPRKTIANPPPSIPPSTPTTDNRTNYSAKSANTWTMT